MCAVVANWRRRLTGKKPGGIGPPGPPGMPSFGGICPIGLGAFGFYVGSSEKRLIQLGLLNAVNAARLKESARQETRRRANVRHIIEKRATVEHSPAAGSIVLYTYVQARSIDFFVCALSVRAARKPSHCVCYSMLVSRDRRRQIDRETEHRRDRSTCAERTTLIEKRKRLYVSSQ